MEYFAFGALSSALMTPFSARLALSMGAVDHPDGARKTHERPTPRLGGIALFFSVLWIGFFFLPDTPLRAAWLTGGALVCVLGVSDDVFSLSPALKLIAELFIATIPIAFGIVPRGFSFGPITFTPEAWVMKGFALLWILLLANAFNLIDGLDTLAATQAMLSLAVFASLPMAPLLGGALFGFLPYNKHSLILPQGAVGARTFLGDTGALFIGYSLALLSLGAWEWLPLFLPLLFLVPIGECVSSFLRRLLDGKNPLSADRGHLHHRLLARTRSVEATVTALALLSLSGLAAFAFLEGQRYL